MNEFNTDMNLDYVENHKSITSCKSNKRNGNQLPSVIAQWKGENIPESFTFLDAVPAHRVREYIPPPTRCYKCQVWKQIAAKCNNAIKCGAKIHETSEGGDKLDCGVEVEKQCANCQRKGVTAWHP